MRVPDSPENRAGFGGQRSHRGESGYPQVRVVAWTLDGRNHPRYTRSVGFDDLARHMASRDRRELSRAATPEAMVAEAARAQRRMNRSRDLILGPVMLVGALIYIAFVLLVLDDARTPNPNRPPSGTVYFYVFTGAAVYGVIDGLRRTIRGLRGRSP